MVGSHHTHKGEEKIYIWVHIENTWANVYIREKKWKIMINNNNKNKEY